MSFVFSSWFSDVIAAIFGQTQKQRKFLEDRISLLEEKITYQTDRADREESECRKQREESEKDRKEVEHLLTELETLRKTKLILGRFVFVIADVHPRFPVCPVCFKENPLLRLEPVYLGNSCSRFRCPVCKEQYLFPERMPLEAIQEEAQRGIAEH